MDVPKPPEDLEIRNIIDKLAQFVARNGPQFEQMTMNKQSGNPKFHFLFGGEHHAYYRFRVASERNNTEMMNPNSPMPPMQFPPPSMVNHSFGPPLPPQQSFHPGVQGAPPQNHPQHFMPPNDNSFHSPLHHHHPPPQQPQHHPHVPPFVEESFRPNNSQFLHPPPILPPHHLHAQHHHQQQQQQQQQPQHKPSPMTTGLIAPPPPIQQQQQPMVTNFNNWNPNAPPTSSFNDTVDSSTNANASANIESQITQIQDHLKESEKNLSAQHDVIMGKEKEQRIENLITKLLDDELKRMCEDFNINLNEFDKILQPIIETCRKESIANGKVWIFNNCTVSEHYDAVAKHLLKRVANMDCQFSGKIHLMYLINDIFNHCMRKHDDKLKAAILKIIVPAFSMVMMEANEEHKQKINKLLKLWEMNQYLDQTLLDQLKTPKESLDAYKTSLHQLYAEQIQTIEKEQAEKYAKTQKQHEDFVVECHTKIQQLQQQKQSLQTNALAIRPPFPPPNVGNMFGPSISTGQVSGSPMPPLPPHQMLPVPGVNPPTSLPYSSPPGNFVGNPMVASNNMNNPATAQPPVHLQRPPFQPPFQSSLPPPPLPGFFPNNPSQPIYPPNSSASINMPMMNLPPTGPGAIMHGAVPLPPPPPQLLSQMVAPPVNPEETPYFERPAGIMTQLIRLEDFDYNAIDPKEIKMPPLLPPSERLLQALEEFYALPARNRPRNSEGWEKLGLHEFFKAKSQARKEYENKLYGSEQPPTKDSNDVYNDTDSSSMQAFSDRQNNNDNNNSADAKKSFDQNNGSDAKSSPKRYKEFREDKSPENRSRSKSIERHDKSSRSKRSRSKSSDSRSRSKSPRTIHRPKVSSSSSSSSKKHSRRKSPSSSPEPRKFHSHKDDKKSAKNNSNDSKRSGITKTMTWSSSTGFTIKEKNPVASNSAASNHSTTASTDIYQGFGSQPSVSNVADPFESFRRNKGQAYIQRIREGRRD